MSYEYDNIMALAKKHNFKKIMIMRNSWSEGNWCIVNKVVFKSDGKYGFAFGHIHYKNGNTSNGQIPCAGTYVWRVIKVLEEDLEVINLSGTEVHTAEASPAASPEISSDRVPANDTNIEDTPIYKALKQYRLETSKAEGVKAYFIYNNAEMLAIIAAMPSTMEDLKKISGFGEVKCQKYGEKILEIVREMRG